MNKSDGMHRENNGNRYNNGNNGNNGNSNYEDRGNSRNYRNSSQTNDYDQQNSRRNGYSRGNYRNSYQDDKNITESYDYGNLIKDLIEENNILCSKTVRDEECLKFDDMNEKNSGLKDNLLRGIISYGFDNPSKIQGLTIPQIIQKKEILAQAQSGTGKTGAFMIGALEIIDETINLPQIIIISPTHELALQTYSVGMSLSQFMGIKFTLTIGNTDRNQNIIDIKNGSQILIATPGRILDLIQSHGELFKNVKMLILDECDELLAGSFQDNIINIITMLPPKDIQLCLFSATLPKAVLNIVNTLMPNCVRILIKKEHISLEGIRQTFIEVVHKNEKIIILKDMLASIPIQQFIVYVNSKDTSDYIKRELEKDDIKILAINRSNSKEERAQIIKDFKKGDAKCLISTDLLARGLDIQQLSLVVNFELPQRDNISAYIHRIGRAGRFGKKGLSINFATSEERKIQNLISTTFKCSIAQITKDTLSETFDSFF